MAWYNVVTYTPPAGSGAGGLGGVGGGWTDVQSKWQTNTVAGLRVIQITDTATDQPWDQSHIVRKASNEAGVNQRISFRWMITTGSGSFTSPWAWLRYVPNTTDNTANGFVVESGLYFSVSGGALGSQVNGTGGTFTAGQWYDTTTTITTSGGNSTITEQSWTVSNPATDAFASGSTVTNNTYNAGTQYANVSGAMGLFAYKPGTFNVSQVSTFSDIAATALTLSPASTSGEQPGTPISYTLTPNGAQNGGSVSLSDGGKGGTFSASTVTLPPGVGGSTTFTYTPASGASGSITITASSSALTGSAISCTATISVAASAASAVTLTPTSQNVVAGQASGSYTASVNGALSGAVTINLSDGGAGGTFSPTSLAFSSSTTSGSFIYTPPSGAASGTTTLTASASGLTSATASAVVAARASALSISPATQSVTAGTVSSNFTVGANGAITSSIAVSLSDGSASGTFSPTSLSLSSGTSSATFTYTPATSANGNVTLSATATGLTAGSAVANVVAQANTVTATDSRIVLSPWTWIPVGAGAVRTNRPGAYMRFIVNGVSAFSVNFGSGTNTNASVMFRIDDGVMGTPVAVKNNAALSVSLPDTGTHTVTMQVNTIVNGPGRWDGSNAIVIAGFGFGSGAGLTAPAVGAKKVLIYGDSIVEGTVAADGTDSFRASWAFVFGEALRRAGWEYGTHCTLNSGISWITPSGNGGQPAAWTSGNDAASAWNKLDGSGLAGAALTNGTIGGASERFIQQPDLILECWGTNDGLNNITDSSVQAQATGLLQRLRVAAPGAVILKVIPFGGYKRAVLSAAVKGLNDRRTLVVDAALDQRMTASGYCGNLLSGASSSQNVHPWSLGDAHIATIMLAAVLGQYIPLATARAFGSAS